MTSNLDGPCHFIRCNGTARAINVYKDSIYTMQKVRKQGSPASHSIHVYDLSGQEVTQWTCSTDGGFDVTSLTINDDQLLVPDNINRRLTVYSLDGHVLRYIPCSLHRPYCLSADMLSCEHGSVIICISFLNKLLKINTTTGEVVQTFDGFNNPTKICLYGPQYVLAVQAHGREIVVLNLKTGEIKPVSFVEDGDVGFNRSCDINILCVGSILFANYYFQGSVIKLYKIVT